MKRRDRTSPRTGNRDRDGRGQRNARGSRAVRPGPPARPARPRRSRHEPFPVTACDCPDCRAACLNSPGWFLPRQLPRLARFLGLTVEETFRRYLAVGVTLMPDGRRIHGVMPHKLRDRKKPGSVWTLRELAAPGRCIFFDRGRCTIHPVRPDECARMLHGREDRAVALRHRIVRHWTAAALAPFARWTGRRLRGSDT